MRTGSPVSVLVASMVQRFVSLDQLAERDPVPVANMRAEVVLVDDLAHVAQDLRCRRDRRAGPGLEAIAEGVEVAVRADARIFVRDPGAAEAFLRFEHDEAGAGALLGEVIGAAHARDAGADDQDVEMLGPYSRRLRLTLRRSWRPRAWPGLSCITTALADHTRGFTRSVSVIVSRQWAASRHLWQPQNIRFIAERTDEAHQVGRAQRG